MSSGDSRKARRLSPRRSPSWENYERFDNSKDEDETHDDIFGIQPKETPRENLRKWRQATLALNASRRFRYTLDLKRAEEREEIKRKIRAHAQAVRATHLFKKAAIRPNKEEEAPPEGFEIGQMTLAKLVREHNINALQQMGGVNQIANKLHTDLDKGIKGGPEEIQSRRNAYGENSYPQKAVHNYFVMFSIAFFNIPKCIFALQKYYI